jgi:hypothetical protein
MIAEGGRYGASIDVGKNMTLGPVTVGVIDLLAIDREDV